MRILFDQGTPVPLRTHIGSPRIPQKAPKIQDALRKCVIRIPIRSRAVPTIIPVPLFRHSRLRGNDGKENRRTSFNRNPYERFPSQPAILMAGSPAIRIAGCNNQEHSPVLLKVPSPTLLARVLTAMDAGAYVEVPI